MFQDRLHFLEAAWGRSLGSVLIGYVKIAAVMLSAGLSAAGSLDPSYTMAMSLGPSGLGFVTEIHVFSRERLSAGFFQ